jgi:hypothetical protein
MQALRDSMPKFGEHKRVSMEELAAALRPLSELTHTVVHLYQNHIETCTRLNFALEDLAAEFAHVQFLRVRSTDAMEHFRDEGLPVLLIYRGVDQIADIARAHEKIDGDINADSVRVLLDRFGVFKLPSVEPVQRAAVSTAASASVAHPQGQSQGQQQQRQQQQQQQQQQPKS